MRLRSSIQPPWTRRLILFLALQGGLQALLDKPLTDIARRVDMRIEGLRNLLIWPIRTIRIGLQQDLGVLDLVGGLLPATRHSLQFLTLLIRQPYDIPLVHLDSPPSFESSLGGSYRHGKLTAKRKRNDLLVGSNNLGDDSLREDDG